MARFAFRGASLQYVGQRVALLDKSERYRIQTVSFAGRRRSVRKDMAKMAAAAGAHLFDANHAVAGIAKALDVRLVVRRKETWPTGAESNFALERNRGRPQK